MLGSELQEYARSILVHVPWTHWVVMGVVSLAVTASLLIRKKCSAYGALCLGLAVLLGLILLDTMVLIRYLGYFKHGTGHSLGVTLDRICHGSELTRIEAISNVAVFAPLGFFLAEFFSATKRFDGWRIVCVAIAALGLSLSIECLQFVLHVGYFEVMDLVLNTVGGVVGACLSSGWRMLWDPNKVGEN